MEPVDLEAAESVLVVVEGNAATPSWPAHLGPPPALGWTLLEQEEWEPQSAFFARLNGALDRSRVVGLGLGLGLGLGETADQIVIFVAGSWLDEEALHARARIANELAGHVAACGGGMLVLTHGHLQDPQLRAELTLLVSELSDEWSGSPLVCSTLFERPSWMHEPRRASDRPRTYARPQLATAR